MSKVTVELMGKPGCHLCDDARTIIERVLADFPSASLVEHDILLDAEMFESMKDSIPVVFINNQQHAQWRIDEPALRAALTEVSA